MSKRSGPVDAGGNIQPRKLMRAINDDPDAEESKQANSGTSYYLLSTTATSLPIWCLVTVPALSLHCLSTVYSLYIDCLFTVCKGPPPGAIPTGRMRVRNADGSYTYLEAGCYLIEGEDDDASEQTEDFPDDTESGMRPHETVLFVRIYYIVLCYCIHTHSHTRTNKVTDCNK
jgi:hypothetical protein